ncbi:terminase large subunit [Vibrio phage VCPH]|nr:terminase large subunit [Vibrio phage VCPH]
MQEQEHNFDPELNGVMAAMVADTVEPEGYWSNGDPFFREKTMKVSRDYIDDEEIIDYPVEERFLKFNIKKFLEIEGITPNGPQVAMINAINDPKVRYVTSVLGRRTGKTFMGNVIAFLKLLEPGTSVCIISPNYSLSNISWMAQLEMIRKHGLETKRANAKDKEVELENGSFLKMASVGNANAALGRSYDLILFDEAAIDDRGGDAFNVVLMPTLDKEMSKAIFISTPRGSNWMKDFYDHGYDDKMPQWCSVFGTWQDNPRVGIDVIESARKAMSKAQFAQEFECSFVTREGVIYEDFDFSKHTFNLATCGLDFDDLNNFETMMGIDPGYRDPTAVIVIKYNFKTDKFYLIDEYLAAGRSTGQHAEVIGGMDDRYVPEMIFVDSAAAQFMADLSYEYDISTTKAKKSILDGISYLQMLIQQDKLYIADHLEHVRECIINYRWKPDAIKETPLHDDYSHMADAIRYGIYSYDRL